MCLGGACGSDEVGERRVQIINCVLKIIFALRCEDGSFVYPAMINDWFEGKYIAFGKSLCTYKRCWK
jgi:hypothetical protein